MNDPFEEILENRRAALELARNAAMRGDPICGAMFALKDLARDVDPFLETEIGYRDEDEDDDIRPY